MKRTLVTAALVGFLGLPAMSNAQCLSGGVSCMNHATLPQRSCSASVMCGGFNTSTGFIMATTSNNVISCTPSSNTFFTPATFQIMAVANQTAPSTRSCGWYWYSASASITGNFSITEADGLPVELLEFSTDDDVSLDGIE